MQHSSVLLSLSSELDQTQLGQALFQFHWATTKKDKGEFFYALAREQAHSAFLVSYALRLLRCGVEEQLRVIIN